MMHSRYVSANLCGDMYLSMLLLFFFRLFGLVNINIPITRRNLLLLWLLKVENTNHHIFRTKQLKEIAITIFFLH